MLRVWYELFSVMLTSCDTVSLEQYRCLLLENDIFSGKNEIPALYNLYGLLRLKLQVRENKNTCKAKIWRMLSSSYDQFWK